MEEKTMPVGSGTEKIDKTLEWLLNFEVMAGEPVVLVLLIEEGKISFDGCFRRSKFLVSGVEEDVDEGSGREFPKKDKISMKLNSNYTSYFG